jgi:hypothetical protein
MAAARRGCSGRVGDNLQLDAAPVHCEVFYNGGAYADIVDGTAVNAETVKILASQASPLHPAPIASPCRSIGSIRRHGSIIS